MRVMGVFGGVGGWLTSLADSGLEGLDALFERLRGRRLKDGARALFLVCPVLIIVGVFGIAPMAASVYMSLFDLKRGVGPYVGLANYWQALTDEPFWNGFLVTVYYAAGTIPVSMVLSFLAANCLFRIVRGRGFFRTTYFLPYVTSAVAAATVWRVILHPQVGPANTVLGWLGIEPKQWLLEPRGLLFFLTGGAVPASVGPSLALCCVMLFEVWHSSGFMVVIFLAGLTAIPRELEEAARIDGAGSAQMIRKVTLPLLSPTIFFLAVVSVIRSFQAFNGFYALTGDGRGPLDTTQNLTVYIYSKFYLYGYWGYGTAVATLLSLAIVTLTLLQWRFLSRRVHHE